MNISRDFHQWEIPIAGWFIPWNITKKKKKKNMHDSGVPLFQHERIGVFWVDGFEGLGNGCFVS